MTTVTIATTPLVETKADAVAIGVFQELPLAKQEARRLDALLGGAIKELMDLGDFRAKAKEFRVLPTRRALPSPRMILVGLGKPKEYTLDLAREVAAKAVLCARDHRLKTVAVPLLPTPPKATPRQVASAMTEGILMGLHEFREYKGEPGEGEDPRVPLEQVILVQPRPAGLAGTKAGVEEGRILAESVNFARTLISRPSIAKAPEVLAEAARKEAEKHGVSCEVLGPAELKKERMGALLGVGQGSVRPPRMVVLEHRGGKKRVLLCGKGIVFDSGGINIKPSEGMDRMKYDMAGSATVLATVLACARLKLPVHVVAIMAIAENMPSGSAIRPGDVVVAHNGKSIEVANTDAEGRLVLADALSYGVKRFDPQAVVDIATLTGAVRVALGNITTGIMGNDDRVIDSLIAAGKRTGDDLWRLPLHKGYEKQVQSDIADVKNMGMSGSAGAIAGAAFLKLFVAGKPWAHLDIAGTCWTERSPADLQKEYMPKGPTGIGVRLLTEWIRSGA